MPGPVPDGGGRGGGGFDPEPTLTISPASPYNAGKITKAAPTTKTVTLRAIRGAVTVSSINFSDSHFSTTDVLPFTVTLSKILNIKITPTAAGVLTCTLTINHSASNSPTKYIITVEAIDPAGQGVITFVPLDSSLPVGQAPTVKLGDSSNTSVGVINTGAAAFNITAIALPSGGPQFVLGPGTPALPHTVNPGDPPVYFPFTFTPDDLGVFNGVMRFTTDLIAPQDVVNAPLSGLCIPFLPVSILDNANRVIMLTFDTDTLKFLRINNFDYGDGDGIIEFNGTLWDQVGQEKTLERLLIYYENVGVCANLQLQVIVLRPSITPDTFDTVTKNVTLGTDAATGEDRSAYIDLTATGELMFLRMIRPLNAGPCSITAIVPFFADRGEKVENV